MSAVRIEMCDCNTHGRLVFEDGTRSSEFVCQSTAAYLIRRHTKDGKIDVSFAELLEKDVAELPVPARGQETPTLALLHEVAFAWQMQNNPQKTFSVEERHAFMTEAPHEQEA